MTEIVEKEPFVFVVEGRRFVQEPTSMDQDNYIMKQSMQAGLDEAQLALAASGDDLERGVKLLLVKAYESGALFRLLAGILIEEGEEWTPQSADANADFFRKSRDPEAKRNLYPAMVGAIIGFFENGDGLSRTSLGSLVAADDPEISVVPKRRISPDEAVALFSSPSGKSSSENSSSSSKTKTRKARRD